MKLRMTSLLLALALLAGLTACGGSGSTESAEPSAPATESTAPMDQPAVPPENEPAVEPMPTLDAEAEPSPEDTTPASPEPSQSTAPSQAPAASPSPSPSPSTSPSPVPSETPAPSESPVPEETPATGSSVDLTAFYNDTLTKYAMEVYLGEYTGELLTNYYPGLTDIATNQCVVYGSMMSMSMSEFALVEVANSADVDAVKAILQGRIDAQAEGGAWYPEATRVWSEQSTVISVGNYVLLVVCDELYADIAADFEAFCA